MAKTNDFSWDDERIGIPVQPFAVDAWIDPIGKFYAVPECGHSKWASRFYGVFESTLENRGWLHISFGNIHRAGSPRQAQIDTLFDLLRAYQAENWKYAPSFEIAFERIVGEVNA